MNALQKATSLQRRTRGDRDEVLCPACNSWRPGFCVVELDEATAALRETTWACDADITKWQRES